MPNPRGRPSLGVQHTSVYLMPAEVKWLRARAKRDRVMASSILRSLISTAMATEAARKAKRS